MSDPVREALRILLDGRDLDEEAAVGAIGAIMDGQSMDGQGDELLVAALLTALRVKGETVDELVGAARAMRARATRIPVGLSGLLDTCGTGGDGLATFNISTAAALVAAAAGVPVAKHGNRAASSTSGSADVLEALGVRIDLTPEQVAACVRDAGIGFCFAPLCHGAMKNVAPIRKRLAFRTVFNLLGPLTNPAGADFQLVGAGRIETARQLAEALARLRVDRAIVVCGNDELDEVSAWGQTSVFIVEGDRILKTTWEFAEPSSGPYDPQALRVNSPEESAAMIRGVLDDEPSAAWDIVVVNAAAALLAARRVEDMGEGCMLAQETLRSGQAAEKLRTLVETTGQLAGG